MPATPDHNPGSNSTASEIVFPVDLLRQVAADLLAGASQAQAIHDQTWNAVQSWIDESAPSYGGAFLDNELIDVRPYLTNVLQPHAQRLRASYDWQMAVAQALFNAIDAVENTEQQIAGSFGGSDSTGQSQPQPDRGPVA